MSKKAFSLIKGGTIHISSKTKVLKAEELSQGIDANEMLNKVKEDAESYRKEVYENQEELKDVARREGFEEGFRQWAEHIVKLEQEINNVRKEVEKLIIPVALQSAKKIVGREMELSVNTIVDIVSNNLKAVSSHKRIKIYVNKNDMAILEKNKTALKQLFEQLESLSLIERSDVSSGGCIIETEGGIINAQLENQWRTLESAFQKLIKHG